MSIESQRAALDQVFAEWRQKNPAPLIATTAGQVAVGAAVGAGKKLGHEAMKVTREVAPVVAEEAIDLAKRGAAKGWEMAKGFGRWLKGNPLSDEEKANALVVDLEIDKHPDIERRVWDWGNRIFEDFDGTWVYYRVPRTGQTKRELVKVAYDPMYDWDFEEHLVEDEIEAEIFEREERQNPSQDGGIAMNNQIVEAKQNPPASPTLYTGVTDATFLPEVAIQNPPVEESLDKLTAEWESAPTPEAKRKIKARVWKGATAMFRGAKKIGDEATMAKAKKLMGWTTRHRVPKAAKTSNPPKPAKVPATESPKSEVQATPAPASPLTMAVTPPEAGNPTPMPIVNPPSIEPAGCQHNFIYLGVGNPKQGGASMKIYRCTNCNKTFAKGV